MMPSGKPITWEECWDLVHAIARRLLRGERGNHTLGATDVVGEVFLRCHDDPPSWRGDAPLRAYFARVVRHVLVDYARRKGAKKRGGEIHHVELDPSLIWHHEDPGHVLAVDEWIQRLEQHDRQLARIVTMRVFGDMPPAEIGEVLALSERQVNRLLKQACAWLERDMRAGGVEPGAA